MLKRLPANRFDMHELVKQYARRQLTELAQGIETHQQHAAYFAYLCHNSQPTLYQLATIRKLDLEIDNIAKAFSFALEHHSFDLLTTMLSPFVRYCQISNRFYVAEQLFVTALTLPLSRQEILHCQLLIQIASIKHLLGKTEEARIFLKEARHIANQLNHVELKVESNYELGMLETTLANYPMAKTYLETAHQYCPDHHALLQSNILSALGNLAYFNGGDINTYKNLHLKALAIRRQHNLEAFLSVSLINLGADDYDRGNIESAKALFEEALSYAHQFGDKIRQAIALNNLGSIELSLNQPGIAQQHYLASLKRRQDVGDKRGSANVLANLAMLAYRLEN